MTRDLTSNHLESCPFEGVDSFHDCEFLSPQLVHTTSSPPHTQRYAEQDNLFSGQHYGQDPWNPNGYHTSIPNMPALDSNNSIIGSIHNNYYPYGHGQENATGVPLADLHQSFPNDHLRQYLPPPAVDASYEGSYEGSSAEGLTPHSSCDEPNQMESTTDLIQCGWQGCTDSTFFGRNRTVWQHIKEKHILPGVFKCSTLGCGKSFDRLSKLNAHSRIHGDNQGQGEKQRTVDLMQCGWRGCPNKNFFGRDTTLWRHTKEKHVLPGAFKCSTLGCGKEFGRRDKLEEHSTTHAGNKGRKGKFCHSCHA